MNKQFLEDSCNSPFRFFKIKLPFLVFAFPSSNWWIISSLLCSSSILDGALLRGKGGEVHVRGSTRKGLPLNVMYDFTFGAFLYCLQREFSLLWRLPYRVRLCPCILNPVMRIGVIVPTSHIQFFFSAFPTSQIKNDPPAPRFFYVSYCSWCGYLLCSWWSPSVANRRGSRKFHPFWSLRGALKHKYT